MLPLMKGCFYENSDFIVVVSSTVYIIEATQGMLHPFQDFKNNSVSDLHLFHQLRVADVTHTTIYHGMMETLDGPSVVIK